MYGVTAEGASLQERDEPVSSRPDRTEDFPLGLTMGPAHLFNGAQALGGLVPKRIFTLGSPVLPRPAQGARAGNPEGRPPLDSSVASGSDCVGPACLSGPSHCEGFNAPDAGPNPTGSTRCNRRCERK